MSKSKSRQSSKAASPDAKSTVKLATDARKSTEERVTEPAPKQAPAASPLPAANKPQTRDAAKFARRQAERQQRLLAERRARRTRNTIIAAFIAVIVVAGSLSAYFFYYLPHTKAQGASAQAPFTEPIYNTDYQPVDNVYCDQLEGSVEHIHAVLNIYINGQQSPLPQGVGIVANQQSGQATCFYWLHTHDSSGVIHIEAPVTEPFTLGQFFDEWNQQFNSLGFPSELLLTNGWTIWVNGHKYNGSLNSIPLDAHNIITIAYNSPNVKPATTYNWQGL